MLFNNKGHAYVPMKMAGKAPVDFSMLLTYKYLVEIKSAILNLGATASWGAMRFF